MGLAERMERRLLRGIKTPLHSLTEETGDYIVFNYPNYIDCHGYQKEIVRETKLLYKALMELKRFCGSIKFVWINDYVIDIDKINA